MADGQDTVLAVRDYIQKAVESDRPIGHFFVSEKRKGRPWVEVR